MSLEEPRDEGGGREQSPRRSSPRKLTVQPFTSNVEDENNIELQDFETSAPAVLRVEDEPTKKTVRVSESYEDAIAHPSKESKK